MSHIPTKNFAKKNTTFKNKQFLFWHNMWKTPLYKSEVMFATSTNIGMLLSYVKNNDLLYRVKQQGTLHVKFESNLKLDLVNL